VANEPSTVAVGVKAVSKVFPGTRALDSVSLDVRKGEVHALVGGNGSGKSTLIKILTGIYRGDSGEVTVAERRFDIRELSPAWARAEGIHVVHQDLGVFPDLSVTENIALGHGYATGFGGRIKWRRATARRKDLIRRYEIAAKPSTPVGYLGRAARTQVAIARALQDHDESREGLLILDEPTTALPAHEVDLLLASLKRYAAAGQAILYVSHRLDEILATADRVTVLRDGRSVGTFESSDLDEQRLIELIVGASVDRVFAAMPPVTDEDLVLETRQLSAGPLRGVDLKLRRGEVVGIAGLLGSGRTELLSAIFGTLPVRAGSIFLEGKEVRFKRARDAMAAGVAFVPEDRVDSVFIDETVTENIFATDISRYWKKGTLRRGMMRSYARQLVETFSIKTNSESNLLATLSGGNQQKVIVSRWLKREPRLLLLDEPTQGVDVGARADIYRFVKDAVANGAAALVVASDFEELAHVVDRAVVLQEGHIAAEIDREHLSAGVLMELIYHRPTGERRAS